MSNKHVVNIRGKDYLTVAGRVSLAHESGRLLGVDMINDSFDGFGGGNLDTDYITVKARVRVLNQQNVEVVERLLAAGAGTDDQGVLAHTINQLLVNTFEGIAKSPKEGSEAWSRLPANAPERSNPTEVCATSALGRALGAAGFGDTESFASADEVATAQNRQSSYGGSTASSNGGSSYKASSSKPPSDKQKKYLQTLVKQRAGITTAEDFNDMVSAKFGKQLEDLSALDVSNWIDELSKAEVG